MASDLPHRNYFDWSVFPQLTTERMTLREISLHDAEAMFAIRGDYEVTKYNSGRAYTTLEQARNLIRGIHADYADRKSIRWGMELKDSHEMVGVIGFNYWNLIDHRGSVGFDLARAYWQQGYMKEALSAMIDFGFSRMGLNRIEADASEHNAASIGLLTRVGFIQEGLQREQYYEDHTYHDLILFSLLRRDWVQREEE